MSFAIKKNNEVTYISQNSATTNPNSDNWSENGTSIYNNNTGNVGINTKNPTFNLDVSGTTNITGNLSFISPGDISDGVAKLVIGGFGGTPYKNGAYSLDGINFIPYSSSNFTPSGSSGDNIRCCAYSPELKIWVAGGTSTPAAPTILYSYDGINWIASPSNPTVATFIRTVLGVFYSSTQRRFVIVGGRISSPSITTVAYSNDGINWTAATPTNLFGVEGRGVAFSPPLNRWVATGRNSIAYSSDASSWITATTSQNGNSVAWMGGNVNKFIIANNIDSVNTIYTSSNGINWTGLGNTFFSSGINVAVNPDSTLAVVVGGGPNGGLAYSRDLSNFTFVSGLPNSYYGAVTYSNYFNAWFAGGGTSIITSKDGINWTPISIPSTLLSDIFAIGAYQLQGGSGLKISSDPSENVVMSNFTNLNIVGPTKIDGQLSQSVDFYTISGDVSLSLSVTSSNVIILNQTSGNLAPNVYLPNITSSNNGLTFSFRYYGTKENTVAGIRSNSNNIYRDGTFSPSAQPITYGSILNPKFVAFNSNWYSINYVNPPASLGLRLTTPFIPLSDISTAITFNIFDTFLSPGFVQIVTGQKFRVNYAGTYLLNVGLEVKAPDNVNNLDFFIRRGAIRTIRYTLQPGVINHISINTCETMSTNEEIYFAAGLTTAPTGSPELRYTTLTFSKINNEYI
jgi:hypothetical protein